MKTSIFIVTHKKIKKPIRIPNYQYIRVNPEIESELSDNTGANISSKNPYYCELTAMYWIWKNYSCDIVGFVHYRRFFCKGLFLNNIISSKTIQKYSMEYDICLNYPENLRMTSLEHFRKGTKTNHLEEIFKFLVKRQPSYEKEVHIVSNSKCLSMRNMLCAKKSVFDKYCSWLFELLFEYEKLLVSEEKAIPPRIFGYLSEELLNVWVLHNCKKIKYLRYGNTVSNHSLRIRLVK